MTLDAGGRRVSEVTHLRVTDIDSQRMVIRIEQGKGRAVIWKTLRLAERRFRRLDAPELLPEVAKGVVYADGARIKQSEEPVKRKAAA